MRSRFQSPDGESSRPATGKSGANTWTIRTFQSPDGESSRPAYMSPDYSPVPCFCFSPLTGNPRGRPSWHFVPLFSVVFRFQSPDGESSRPAFGWKIVLDTGKVCVSVP